MTARTRSVLVVCSAACVFAFVAGESSALAQSPAPDATSAPASSATSAAASPPKAAPAPPNAEPHGVIVVNASARVDDAMALARAVDASALRPSSLDVAHARVVAGAPASDDAPADVRELAELRAALDTEDAAARRLLTSLASQFGAAGIVVLHASAPLEETSPTERERPPTARLFLSATGDFDAARYEPDASRSGDEAWRGVVVSLERSFAAPPKEPARPRLSGNALAVRPVAEPRPREHEDTKPFYASGWFWGAVGGAALLGAGIYFASQGSDSDTVQLRMQVPR